jgi:hypothetical protein
MQLMDEGAVWTFMARPARHSKDASRSEGLPRGRWQVGSTRRLFTWR